MSWYRRFAMWMDRPGWPGWVWYGPNGLARGWAPVEWLAEMLQHRDEYAHDRARCGTNWIN